MQQLDRSARGIHDFRMGLNAGLSDGQTQSRSDSRPTREDRIAQRGRQTRRAAGRFARLDGRDQGIRYPRRIIQSDFSRSFPLLSFFLITLLCQLL
jgi:hypothetical protein